MFSSFMWRKAKWTIIKTIIVKGYKYIVIYNQRNAKKGIQLLFIQLFYKKK